MVDSLLANVTFTSNKKSFSMSENLPIELIAFQKPCLKMFNIEWHLEV